jgi:hypothetical protein
MSVPDRIPPQDMFAADLEQLIRDVEEFKQFQRGGQDSVRMYRIFSADAYDKEVTNVQFRNRRFRLTFTPDEGAERGLVYKMEYTYTQSGFNSVEVLVERENVDNADGSQTWLFQLSGSDFFPTPWSRLKFFFWASGSGTFSTTDL